MNENYEKMTVEEAVKLIVSKLATPEPYSGISGDKIKESLWGLFPVADIDNALKSFEKSGSIVQASFKYKVAG